MDPADAPFSLLANEETVAVVGSAFMRGDANFQRAPTGKDEWLTPPEIIRALGDFDLDPCSPVPERRPWPTARNHFSIEDNGLRRAWTGRVWLNPPYGSETKRWMLRLAEHGDGVALIFARTETATFFDAVWGRASAMLFLRGRLIFRNIDGTRADNSAAAPSVLIAYGESNAAALRNCGLDGFFVTLFSTPPPPPTN